VGDIVLVMRIEDLPEPYAPAERASCSRCAAPVWLGYAVRIDAPFARPMCMPCAVVELEPGAELTVTPEVRREVLEALRRRRLT